MSQNSKLKAGAAETIVTPPMGAPTLGTIQRSTGVHDELYARALVLNDGKQRVAILSLDLIGMDFELSDEIRDAIHARTGIATTLVHCTHNHSGPFNIPWSVLGPRWVAGPGKNWRDGLAPKLTELVARAEAKSVSANCEPAGHRSTLAPNRRLQSETRCGDEAQPIGPVVPWVDVLCVERIDKAPSLFCSVMPLILSSSTDQAV